MKQPNSESKYIRPAQWAQLTNMSRAETYRNLYAGRIRAVKIERQWFIHASELTDFFERHDMAA